MAVHNSQWNISAVMGLDGGYEVEAWCGCRRYTESSCKEELAGYEIEDILDEYERIQDELPALRHLASCVTLMFKYIELPKVPYITETANALIALANINREEDSDEHNAN